jgi:tetratricopeptide (TPR) repeat protein
MRKNVYDPEAYFLKGMVYKDLKDTAKAISSFQTAVQVAPDYKDAVVQLGLLFAAKKDEIGVRYLENAFAIDTTDVFPIYAIGVYYQETRQDAKAKEQYRRCILRNRHYADAYFNMGYILMQEDSTQKAWRQYDMVTKIDPLNPTAYYNRGICSELMDSTRNAINDYLQAVRLDTGYASPKEALRRLKVKRT